MRRIDLFGRLPCTLFAIGIAVSAHNSNEIEAQLSAIQQRATDDISAASSLDELDKVRVKYLGKKGELSKVLGCMGKLPAEERPKVGGLTNQIKTSLQTQIDRREESLQLAQIKAQLEAETLDVTMPGVYRTQGRIHPINSIIDQITDIFVGLGYTVAQSQEIKAITTTRSAKLFARPPGRDMQDTLYCRADSS